MKDAENNQATGTQEETAMPRRTLEHTENRILGLAFGMREGEGRYYVAQARGERIVKVEAHYRFTTKPGERYQARRKAQARFRRK